MTHDSIAFIATILNTLFHKKDRESERTVHQRSHHAEAPMCEGEDEDSAAESSANDNAAAAATCLIVQ